MPQRRPSLSMRVGVLLEDHTRQRWGLPLLPSSSDLTGFLSSLVGTSGSESELLGWRRTPATSPQGVVSRLYRRPCPLCRCRGSRIRLPDWSSTSVARSRRWGRFCLLFVYSDLHVNVRSLSHMCEFFYWMEETHMCSPCMMCTTVYACFFHFFLVIGMWLAVMYKF